MYTSHLSLYFHSYFTTKLNEGTIKIRPNVVIPGSVYTFSLTASDANGASFSSISFFANIPPSSGYLECNPCSGFALDTKFAITASGWTTAVENYPLLYKFSYFAQSSSQEIQLTTTFSETRSVENVQFSQVIFYNIHDDSTSHLISFYILGKYNNSMLYF
jgi:hypothetical protein